MNLSKIKIAELFYSLQGEGQYLGTPSIFLRTFGCNFMCRGFSMPRGYFSEERAKINPADYERYEDLPLVHTGCDSYASWDYRFKHLSPMMDVKDIVTRMQELLPNGKFGLDKHLIITGGEPLLGWQRSYPDLINEIRDRGMELSHITFETNGTQLLEKDFYNFLLREDKHLNITFSVSSKLPSSGEKWEDAIKPEVIEQYCLVSNLTYFKWVISSEEDYLDVKEAIKAYKNVIEYNNVPIYIMPAGGTTKFYDLNEKMVAELCMKNGWRYTPRLQVQLWKNAWGT